MTVTLRTQGLSKQWGAFKANDGISIELPGGSRHALIGPNGAGKTTFINLLTGVFPPSAGEVFLGDERITHLSQHARAKRGLTRTYQITTLFPGLTVLESVILAICARKGTSRVWWKTVAERREEIDEALDILRTLHLEDAADAETSKLAYGRQRIVEIALALATRPKILLLDEPAAGIPTADSAELFAVIDRLPADVTVLFIEHDMEIVFRFAHRIIVLVAGQVLAQGTPAEIAGDAAVKAVYLGESAGEPTAHG